MKKKWITYSVMILGLLFAWGNEASAQTQPQAADLDLNLGYEPQTIVDEWDAWFNSPNPSASFIQDFMDQNQVPQEGLYGLTRKETWYWWASHHPYQVHQYMTLRDQQQQNN